LSEAFDALAAAGQPWNGIRATGFQNDAIDDQSLRRLNASIRHRFSSPLLQQYSTVVHCGNLAGFVPQRRRWIKIS
jgi:hypothetical protein